MALRFDWDPATARDNLGKHRVRFDEASSALGDPLSITIADPDPLGRRGALPSCGPVAAGRLIVVAHIERGDNIRLISARGGVRGKYARRFRAGANVMVLEPDVAARFPTAEAVNRALRAIVKIADETESPRKSRRRTA
jgi:uncharacterized DUF497 family protein